MLIAIDDPADPRLEPYRDIRERDLVKNRRQFIAEGKTVLAVLAGQSRFKIRSVLLLENRVDGLRDITDTLPEDCPVYVVNRAIIDQVAGFPMHRGILAIADRPEEIDRPPDPDRSDRWHRVVALSEIANHDNMGSIFRNAAAFGADAVLMDAQCCDPLYRKAVRVSVGGVLKVPFHMFETTDMMLAWLAEAGFEIAALSPSGATPLTDWAPANRSAILMGAEGPGLPRTVLEQLTAIRIGMAGGFDSLNVATATGIALHHMFESRKAR